MGQDTETHASLGEVLHNVAKSAPRMEMLLARYFPATGGSLYPDAAGNVCVVEGSGLAADRPASVYARCVSKLGPLVAEFASAALDQAAAACIRLAKERTVFACALEFARRPLDPMQRQLFVARMMPQPAPLFRQDDATASCIWLRLWTLHAWVLELRLAIALSGGASVSEQKMLAALDGDFSGLLRPDAQWLSVDLGAAAPAEMVARAPVEALSVGNLAWPNRLGAMLPDGDFCPSTLRRAGIGFRQENGRSWLSFGTRCADLPVGEPTRPRSYRDMRLGA